MPFFRRPSKKGADAAAPSLFEETYDAVLLDHAPRDAVAPPLPRALAAPPDTVAKLGEGRVVELVLGNGMLLLLSLIHI